MIYLSVPGELARTMAARDKWRALAKAFGPVLRTALRRLEVSRDAVAALQIENASLGGRLARAELQAKRYRVEAEDLRHKLMIGRRHLDSCPVAIAVADHVYDKAVSNR